MLRKYSVVGAKVVYRLFIIGSAAFFLAASAHNMLSSLFSAGPVTCQKSIPEATAAK